MNGDRIFFGALIVLVAIMSIIGTVAIILGVTGNPAPYGVG